MSYTLKGSNSFDRGVDRFVDLNLDFGALNFDGAWFVRPPLKFCRGLSREVNVSAHSLLMCGIGLGYVVWQCS